MNRIANIIGFYLPAKFQRWFIYLPIDLTACAAILVAVLCLKASFIHGDPFFQVGVLTQDADLQLRHLHSVLQKSASTGHLNIMEGYSQLCGYSSEWDACFYAFYCMTLRELAKISPERIENIRLDMNLCARGILRVPPTVSDSELGSYFAKRSYGKSVIHGGYVGIVLGTRKLVVKDTLFDIAMMKNAEELAIYLLQCLDHADEFWSSDHATQLYAVWLYDQATGKGHERLFRCWGNVMKKRFLEKKTGLLYSEMGVNPDKILSEPRGSSIGWTALFLVDVLPEFARDLYDKLCAYRERRFFNFEGTAEFTSRSLFQFGDTDSGPLIFGISPSATGEAFCCHKLFGDKARFTRILRVFEVFGDSYRDKDRMFYRHANALGDVILLYAKICPVKKRGPL